MAPVWVLEWGGRHLFFCPLPKVPANFGFAHMGKNGQTWAKMGKNGQKVSKSKLDHAVEYLLLTQSIFQSEQNTKTQHGKNNDAAHPHD